MGWGPSLGIDDLDLFEIWDLEIGIFTPKLLKCASPFAIQELIYEVFRHLPKKRFISGS